MTDQRSESPPGVDTIRSLLDRIPSGSFVVTAAHEDQRRGVVLRWVQRCCDTPPMLMISVAKEHQIAAVVRDAKRFAICQLADDDRFTVRRIAMLAREGPEGFAALEMHTTPGGCPVIERAVCWFECELVRHVDIECDNELFVGEVVDARLLAR